MADIFGRPNTGYQGGYDSSTASLSFGDSDVNPGSKLLVENASLTYQQQISRVFELGHDYTYLVSGRTQGNGNLGSVIGPKKVESAFYASMASVCSNTVLAFNFASGAPSDANVKCDEVDVKRIANGVVATNLSFNVAAQDMLIRETVAFEYAEMTDGS